MDYVQNPYFTDENVKKEQGIIGQEIMMYQDYPEWRVYINALKCLYKNNPIKLDITGSIESISKINKDILYSCYNTFYNPSNMALVVSGDFEPDLILNEIKKRLIEKQGQGIVQRIYPQEPNEINKKEITEHLEVNTPLFVIGIKDNNNIQQNKVKKHIAIEIILNLLIGKSSDLYKRLYEQGLLLEPPSLDYELSKQYAHIMVSGGSSNPKQILNEFKKEIIKIIKSGIDSEDLERIKKRIYGDYVKEFNNVDTISTMFLADYFKGINSFEYLEEYENVNKEYVEQILKNIFIEQNIIISIISK